MPLIVTDRGAIAYARELSATSFGEWRAHVLAGTTPRERQTRMHALPNIRNRI